MSLLTQTLKQADAWLREFRNPVVLWSGGKDSTVLLHLLLFKLGAKLPCVQWREPRFRHRYAYSDELIAAWDLEVYDYAPSAIHLATGMDVETGALRIDAVKEYMVAPNATIAMCLGTENPTEGSPYLCGLKDFLQRPLGTFNPSWDALFHGHKSCDIDLIKGNVPLSSHIQRTPGKPSALYILRDWTDDDVFRYLESEGVPMDPTRYEKIQGKWQHKRDKRHNADYYSACFNCVNRHLSDNVYCPKLGAQVNNISDFAPYIDLEFPSQGVYKTWNTTANPAELAAPTNEAGPCCGATAPTPPASLPTTSAPTTPCSRPTPADAASPSVARWAEESPAQYMNPVRPPAAHSSQAAHSA